MTEPSAIQAESTRRRRWKKRVIRIATGVLILWLASTALTDWIMTRRFRGPRPEPMPALPGVEIQEQRLITSDYENLGAWFIRGRPDAPSVLLLHGIGGTRRDFVPMLRPLHDDGYNVLALTLRAHGDSTGRREDFGYSSAADVIAGVRFLQQQTPGGRIVICGTSLGAAAALFAAKDLSGQVSGYVLESPYYDLNTAVRNRMSIYLPPVLDSIGYAGLRLWSPLFLPVPPTTICPGACAAAIPATVPVIILTGTADRHATLREAQQILQQVQTHAQLIEFPGGEHAELYKSDPGKYYGVLRAMLDGKGGKLRFRK